MSFKLYSDDDNFYFREKKRKRIEMPNQRKARDDYYPTKDYSKFLYSDKDEYYIKWKNKTENLKKQFPNGIEMPNASFWEKFGKEKSKGIKNEEDIDVFYTEEGIMMLARLGARKEELIEYFGNEGKKVIDKMKENNDWFLRPFIENEISIFKTYDPDESIENVTRRNSELNYPKIQPNREIPLTQTPNLISVPQYEGDISQLLDVQIGDYLCDNGFSNVCDNNKIKAIFDRKDDFGKLEKDQFLKARVKANPYEKIDKPPFMNRAAFKMANLDAIFNFTNSNVFSNQPFVPDPGDKSSFYYFADVCAGPGGFTDYLYYRLKERAFGFGMTLAGDHDWRRDDAFLTMVPRFVKEYGPEGNGNIFNPENIAALETKIRKKTKGKMVQLLTADGGTDATLEENSQENIHKRLYLCQFLTSLCVLCKGGSFVCKVFDCYTDFTVQLLYVLAQCFEKFCIIKPFTSRPANSERYVVGLGLRDRNLSARTLLAKLNDHPAWEMKDKNQKPAEIYSFIDNSIIPQEFIDYVKNSNEELVDKQFIMAGDLLTFAVHPDLQPAFDHEDIKRKCLMNWKLPLSDIEISEKRRIQEQCRKMAPSDEIFIEDDASNDFPLQITEENTKEFIPQEVKIIDKGKFISTFGIKLRKISELINDDEDPAIAIEYNNYYQPQTETTFIF